MPRAPRYHVPGDLYHVISRGNHRETVFRDDRDFTHYLELMERYSQRYGVKIHAYALMRNHTHLLVQEGEQPLSRFMKGVQQSFAQFSNTRYRQSGHLFQGRYKAFRVEREEYLLGLVRYIQMNPVKAGVVQDPADYPWTSHRHYYLGEHGYGLETSLIRGLMARSGGTEIADYELLSERIEREVEGSDQVAARDVEPGPQLQVVATPTAIDQIAERVTSSTGIPLERLRSRQKDRVTSNARWLLIYLAAQSGHPLTAIARYLGVSIAGASLALRAIEQDLQAGGEWRERITSEP